MGSTGTGNFSDYKNFPRAIKGVTGADDSEDKCALAFSTLIEDVDTCEYYSKKGTLPAIGTEVYIDFKVRLVAKSNDGLIIGYLLGCPVLCSQKQTEKRPLLLLI